MRQSVQSVYTARNAQVVANLPVCGQGCQSGALLSSVVIVEIRIWDDPERRKVNVKAI